MTSGFALLDVSEMKHLLTDKQYVVMSWGNEDGFYQYLEEKYFTPGTPRNAEFEIVIGPINTSNGHKMSFWVRIKRTKLNEAYLFAALQEFYNLPLKRSDFKKRLKKIRDEINSNIPTWFSFEQPKEAKP